MSPAHKAKGSHRALKGSHALPGWLAAETNVGPLLGLLSYLLDHQHGIGAAEGK